MKNILITRMKKDELLAILEENRKQHRDVFLEAQSGFKEKVISELEQRLEDARYGKRVDLYIRLAEPQDQTKDYDRVIKMMKVTQEEIIELDETSFAQYVMDEWQWKGQFLGGSAMYLSDATNRKLGNM